MHQLMVRVIRHSMRSNEVPSTAKQLECIVHNIALKAEMDSSSHFTTTKTKMTLFRCWG